MIKKNVIKNNSFKKIKSKEAKTNLSTYERLTQDPKRKAKIEREYKDLLLSELLIALMEEDRVSVKKLALAAGISPSIIQDIRSGKKENITLKTFSSIAGALGYGIELKKLDQTSRK
ncbi:helix-turn-helix transcriptional regulator [Candidatus Babeliales bacterium]|nr:helix-turn-helix transcriptional regulator [Candidatus Babeliales bacterium]MCF7899120.1 helix-turn-helix transcriptional regulator [Candidatus Babeliales bacterium]